MERIKVTIEGTTPLLMNKFSDAAAIQAASGTSPVMVGNKGTPREPGMFATPLVRQLVDDAGKRIGLGDFRPARKGPFGRFVVQKWEPEK